MEIEPLNLDWNIHYEFILNNRSPIEPTLIFEIPIQNKKHTVYIQLPFYEQRYDSGYVLLLDSFRFISAWRNSKDDGLFPGYHQGDAQIWRKDRKFHYAEHAFSRGKKLPCVITGGIRYDKSNGIIFNDGLTRTIWLLANEAEYFPIFSNKLSNALALKEVSSRKNCKIWSCADLLTHHFQSLSRQYQGLIP